MYLRRNRRRKGGEDYDYWTLLESVRTARGPRQRIVAHIGKEPGLDEDERLGWEQIGKLLDGEEDEREELLELFAGNNLRLHCGPRLICGGSGWNGYGSLAKCMWRWLYGDGWGCTGFSINT